MIYFFASYIHFETLETRPNSWHLYRVTEEITLRLTILRELNFQRSTFFLWAINRIYCYL